MHTYLANVLFTIINYFFLTTFLYYCIKIQAHISIFLITVIPNISLMLRASGRQPNWPHMYIGLSKAV